MRQWIACGLLLAGALSAAAGEGTSPIAGTNELAHLQRALYCLNMGESDLAFGKDHAKPLLVVDRVRALLENPLALPAMGDEILAAARASSPAALWELSAGLLGLALPAPAAPAPPSAPAPWAGKVAPELAAALDAFMTGAAAVRAELEAAYRDVPAADRQVAAAALFADTFDAESRHDTWLALVAMGVTSQAVDRAIAEGKDIDPAPAASNYLAIVRRIDYAQLLAAARGAQAAAMALQRQAAGVTAWPEAPVTFATALGDIRIGTPHDDRHAAAALLTLDPGGDDRYVDDAASVNGLAAPAFGCVVDLAGNDHYAATGLLGAATALFGVSAVLDGGGDDVYRAAYSGLGAGFFGAALLQDEAGDDVYTAQALAEGTATAGIGILRDAAGQDTYTVGYGGQGFAGVYALAWLVDVEGSDSYISGGLKSDYGRRGDHFLTLSQGFSIGMRPFAGGGVGGLIDLGGNDHYQADMFGQGASYWYAAGFLLDTGGNDTYEAYQYSQGSGIHISSGLLYDSTGNDLYTGWDICQGSSHDYGVGMLFDREGADTYTANDSSQGRGIYNSIGILVDSTGDDAYMGRNRTSCQGVGDGGGPRDYGSLALLLDLGGNDLYTSGVENGARAVRPLYGLIYDLEAAP